MARKRVDWLHYPYRSGGAKRFKLEVAHESADGLHNPWRMGGSQSLIFGDTDV